MVNKLTANSLVSKGETSLTRFEPLSLDEQNTLDHLLDNENVIQFILEQEEAFKAILKCNTFAQAKKKFRFSDSALMNTAQTLFEKRDILLSIAKNRTAHVKPTSYRISETLLDLSNPVSYLFLLVDGIFTLVTSIGVLSFMAAGSIFAGMAVLIGVVHFVGMAKEIKHRDEKINRRYQLLALQNECVDIYLKHKLHLPTEVSDEVDEVKIRSDKKWQNAKDALGSVVLVASTLFYSYYAITLALSVAFTGLAFVSVMTGPIGIGVALGVAIGVGLAIGYMKYRQDTTNQVLKAKRKKMENDFNHKFEKYQELRLQELNNQPETRLSPVLRSKKQAEIEKEEKKQPAAFPFGNFGNHTKKEYYGPKRSTNLLFKVIGAASEEKKDSVEQKERNSTVLSRRQSC